MSAERKADLMWNIPSHYTLQYSSNQVADAVSRVGSSISRWAAEIRQQTGQDLLAVPVLRGGIYFFADITRNISESVEVAPGRAKAYETGVNAVQRETVQVSLDGVQVKGRGVLLVDDICDSGRTMKTLSNYLLQNGAHSVKAAVLIRRNIKAPHYTPEWSAFDFDGDDWFVGYGMDDEGHYSNLPAIYTIKPAK